jgi:GNAT superfamily N-acetyltransferase
MDEILIREAGLDDIPHILHHRTSMFREMGNHDEDAHRRMLISTEAFLRDTMPGGAYRGWMAESGDRVVAGVGLAILQWLGSPEDPAPRRGWIVNVYTEPEFRRRKLARRLMDVAVEWCRAEGFVNIAR